MSRTRWSDVADALINIDWGTNGDLTPSAFIQEASDDRLSMILLRDIARSLRVLRCSNFVGIPAVLRGIEKNTHRPKRRKAHGT